MDYNQKRGLNLELRLYIKLKNSSIRDLKLESNSSKKQK